MSKLFSAIGMFFKEIYVRFAQPSPDFFKKLQVIWGSLASVSTLILYQPQWFPDWMDSTAPYTLIIAAFGAGQAGLAVKDPKALTDALTRPAGSQAPNTTEPTNPDA
jgi:hypothetical protein